MRKKVKKWCVSRVVDDFIDCLCRQRRHSWKVERKALSNINFKSAEADMGYKIWKRKKQKKATK